MISLPSLPTAVAARLGGQVKRAKLPTRALPILAPMVASARPLIPPTSAPARLLSTARPASKMSTSVRRPPPRASTVAFVSTKWARITADARQSTLGSTVRHHTCRAAPRHARTEAPASKRETPPTTAPAYQASQVSTVSTILTTVQATAARTVECVWME